MCIPTYAFHPYANVSVSSTQTTYTQWKFHLQAVAYFQDHLTAFSA